MLQGKTADLFTKREMIDVFILHHIGGQRYTNIVGYASAFASLGLFQLNPADRLNRTRLKVCNIVNDEAKFCNQLNAVIRDRTIDKETKEKALSYWEYYMKEKEWLTKCLQG